LKYKFYFIFVAFNIVITFPTIFLTFKETKQVSLEDIDLLFGERALGTLPADLELQKHKSEAVMQENVTATADKEMN
jgi:hypothetical protein